MPRGFGVLVAVMLVACASAEDPGEAPPERPPRVTSPAEDVGDGGTDGGETGDGGEDATDHATRTDTPDPDATLPDGSCTPNRTRCVDDETMDVCDADGEAWTPAACESGERCFEGRCRPVEECTAGATRCATGQQQETCDDTGSGWVAEGCPGSERCIDGACRPAQCVPGENACRGDDVVACDADGQFAETVRTCAANRCENGACQDGCVFGDKGVVGCEFFAVKLDHMGEGVSRPFAVTVSNASAQPVTVSVSRGDGTAIGEHVIAASALETIPLPRLDVPFSSLTHNSIRLSADGPVTVHQFAPIDRQGFASADASLLLPSTSWGTDYIVVGWPSLQASRWSGQSYEGRPNQGRAYVTIVAAQDNTVVEFTPTTATEAGGGVPAVAVGSTHQFTLSSGQVASFATPAQTGLDLTGSRITSSLPVGVFFGHMCAEVPVGNCCCDHIEQQLVPVDTWGTEVIATKFRPRGTEVDYWRFVAAQDGTIVELTPAVEGLNDFTLNAGEVRQLRSSTSFLARASGPILAGQFMAAATAPGVPGSGCGGSGGLGDPAMTLNVGAEQYISEYIVLIPPQGFREHALSFVYRSGETVTLNSSPLPGTGTTIPGTQWTVHHVGVSPGIQRASGSAPFGLYAYGVDCAVSYAYPGGMNLEDR